MMKCIYGMQINVKIFFNFIVSFWVCIASHAQNSQNNKSAISLQILKESVKDEVDFLPTVKHQRFLQSDTIILGVCVQAYPNYPE